MTAHGTLARPPRGIRTIEGWEVASLLVAPSDARGSSAATDAADSAGDPRGPDRGALLAVCSGAGASRALAHLAVGDEVVVVGRLVPRRGARPEDDSVELVADAVLARRAIRSVSAEAPEPRIAP